MITWLASCISTNIELTRDADHSKIENLASFMMNNYSQLKLQSVTDVQLEFVVPFICLSMNW